jgi:hypothetical protein
VRLTCFPLKDAGASSHIECNQSFEHNAVAPLCILKFHLTAAHTLTSITSSPHHKSSAISAMDSPIDAADCDGGDENISVCLRIRQFTPDEIARHDKVALTCTDGRTVTVRGKLPDRDDKDISCSYALTCALTQTTTQTFCNIYDRCADADLFAKRDV